MTTLERQVQKMTGCHHSHTPTRCKFCRLAMKTLKQLEELHDRIAGSILQCPLGDDCLICPKQETKGV